LDWILIRIGIQPKTLDPDPYQMNSYPKPCSPVVFLPGVDAYGPVDEALDVALLDLPGLAIKTHPKKTQKTT
jgi:hypothetical protein